MYQQIRLAHLDLLKVEGDEKGAHILLLHGFGADALDLVPLSQIYRERPRPTWLFPNGSLSIPLYGETRNAYQGKAWFEIDFDVVKRCIAEQDFEGVLEAFPQDISRSRQQILDLIAELNIPLSNLFLGGFSQGALLATEVALHLPTTVLGLIVLSGTPYNVTAWKQLASNHSGLHFFQSHGMQDPILPFSKARELETLFLQAQFKGHLEAFQGAHSIPQIILVKLHHFLKSRMHP